MPILLRKVVPFAFWYLLLIALAIALDLFFHRLGLFGVGRYLGICGTILLLLSFVYSLRKRKLINFGSPKKLLNAHEYLSSAGVLMILVHAGWHFNAVLPWLAVALMVVVVASGFTGKFLLREARERLKVRKQALQDAGEVSRDDLEKRLFLDSLTVDLMENWRHVHLPLTAIFAALTTVHIHLGLVEVVVMTPTRTLLAFLILATAFVFAFPEAAINPGSLSKGHSEPAQKCWNCHQPFWGANSGKCTACHKIGEIGRVTTAGNPLHVADAKHKVLFHAGLANKDCLACHTTHRNARYIARGPRFAHDLLDASIRSDCVFCHTIARSPRTGCTRRRTSNVASVMEPRAGVPRHSTTTRIFDLIQIILLVVTRVT